MALKDWENFSAISMNGDIIFIHKNRTKEVIIKKLSYPSMNPYKDNWKYKVIGYDDKGKKLFEDKLFNTKSQALTFAKQYMRTH